MPSIITTVHDPVALAATCRRLNVPAPKEDCIHLADQEVCGWIVHLPGTRYPIVCNTLTGLIAYHPHDNAFNPYAHIMRFIHLAYATNAELRQGKHVHHGHKPFPRMSRCPALAG